MIRVKAVMVNKMAGANEINVSRANIEIVLLGEAPPVEM